MAVMRDWITPLTTTALVAWIMIPLPPADPSNYDTHAVSQHRVCALQGHLSPDQQTYYPPDGSRR